MANRIIRPADWKIVSRAKSGSDMDPKVAPRKPNPGDGDNPARWGRGNVPSADNSKMGDKVQKTRVRSQGVSEGDSKLAGNKSPKVPSVNRGLQGPREVPKMATKKATKGNLRKNG